MCNCGCLVFIHSNLIATSSPVEILVPTIDIYRELEIYDIVHLLDTKSLFTVQTPDSIRYVK